MIKISTIFLFICFSYITNAQNYIHFYNAINQAKSFEKKGKKQKAIKIYTKNIEKYPFVAGKYIWNTIVLANELNLKELGYSLMTKLLSQSSEPAYKEYVTQSKQLKIFHADTVFNKLPSDYYQPKFMFSYKNIIDSLCDLDRMVRMTDNDATDYYSKVKREKQVSYNIPLYLKGKRVIETIALTDSLNFVQLKELIEKNKTTFDERDIIPVYPYLIILAHSSSMCIKHIKPLLDKSLKEGKLEPYFYAWIVDRALKDKDKPPFYYWDTINHNTEINIDISIFNPLKKRKINKRRKKIGLPLLPITMANYRD